MREIAITPSFLRDWLPRLGPRYAAIALVIAAGTEDDAAVLTIAAIAEATGMAPRTIAALLQPRSLRIVGLEAVILREGLSYAHGRRVATRWRLAGELAARFRGSVTITEPPTQGSHAETPPAAADRCERLALGVEAALSELAAAAGSECFTIGERRDRSKGVAIALNKRATKFADRPETWRIVGAYLAALSPWARPRWRGATMLTPAWVASDGFLDILAAALNWRERGSPTPAEPPMLFRDRRSAPIGRQKTYEET